MPEQMKILSLVSKDARVLRGKVDDAAKVIKSVSKATI